ncbi:gonadotropin releasing hormone receptor 1 isoform X2 [Brachyhypopomus gauderio]|uniref:gonadotropin releasing hormone receptor 1 isoform X2 n=1 Tax=Brachyhypopomus gauderio TaxID=698409 RepID=UPI0040410B28
MDKWTRIKVGRNRIRYSQAVSRYFSRIPQPSHRHEWVKKLKISWINLCDQSAGYHLSRRASRSWRGHFHSSRMSGNSTLLLPSPTSVLVNSSVLNASPSWPLPAWDAPAFTEAARFRVIATLVLFVFAAISNLSVVLSVTRGRGRRLAAHLRPLIGSLACADLVMTFVVMPLDAAWNVTVQWYAGDGACKLLCFLKLFAMHSVAFILVVVSLDRHHAILHPLDALDAGRRNRRMLLAAWTLSLLLASPQLFIFRAIKAEGVDFVQCATHGSFQQRWQETAYNMFHFITLYVFPLLVMSCCYTRILVEINRQMHRSKNKGEPCLRRSGTDMIPKARMKTLKMTIIIVASFVICWTPYYLLGIWYWFQPKMLQTWPAACVGGTRMLHPSLWSSSLAIGEELLSQTWEVVTNQLDNRYKRLQEPKMYLCHKGGVLQTTFTFHRGRTSKYTLIRTHGCYKFNI